MFMILVQCIWSSSILYYACYNRGGRMWSRQLRLRGTVRTRERYAAGEISQNLRAKAAREKAHAHGTTTRYDTRRYGRELIL
jgi:hypothetical protein